MRINTTNEYNIDNFHIFKNIFYYTLLTFLFIF